MRPVCLGISREERLENVFKLCPALKDMNVFGPLVDYQSFSEYHAHWICPHNEVTFYFEEGVTVQLVFKGGPDVLDRTLEETAKKLTCERED